jgi:putative endonuclease
LYEIPNEGKRHAFYYVYLLLCDDGSYYTGYTSNLDVRLHRHERGRGARYTKMRRPKRIVYAERFRTRRAAMRREREIKALTHNQKRDLARKTKTIRTSYPRKTPFLVT